MADELVGLLGSIYTASGNSITFTDEATSNAGDNKTYTITNSAKKYFDPATTVTVEVDGSPVTSGFTVQYAGGVVVFDADQGASEITVSGKYFTVAEVGAFFNYKISLNKTPLDTTSFIDSADPDFGWETVITGQKSFEASAEKFYIDNTINTDVIAGKNLLIVFYISESTAVRYEGYGFITKEDINNDLKELIKEALSIKGNGPIYYRD